VIYLIILYFTFLQSDNSQKIVEEIRDNFKDAETIKIFYTEKISDGFDFETSLKAEFWFKSPGKFRYNTEEQLMVTNLKTMWDLKYNTKQVRIDEYYPDKSKVDPSDFLINFEEGSNSLYLRKENGQHVIKLIPKADLQNQSNLSLQDEYTIIYVDADSDDLKKIEMFQSNGNIVTYIIDKIEIDEDIADSEFELSDLEGLEVIDLRF
jgi:outer membrane lipoprotein-sorting protein